MGAACASSKASSGEMDMFKVENQDLLMDNNEVKIIHLKGTKIEKPKDAQKKGKSAFDGFLQR